MTMTMASRIEELLRRHGALTFKQLRRYVGPQAYGPHNMVVFPVIVFRGLSQEFGDAVEHLIFSSVIRVDEIGRIRLITDLDRAIYRRRKLDRSA